MVFRETVLPPYLVMWSPRGGRRGVAGALLSSEGRSFLKPIFGVEALGVPPAGVGAREAGRLLCTLLKLLGYRKKGVVIEYVMYD